MCFAITYTISMSSSPPSHDSMLVCSAIVILKYNIYYYHCYYRLHAPHNTESLLLLYTSITHWLWALSGVGSKHGPTRWWWDWGKCQNGQAQPLKVSAELGTVKSLIRVQPTDTSRGAGIYPWTLSASFHFPPCLLVLYLILQCISLVFILQNMHNSPQFFDNYYFITCLNSYSCVQYQQLQETYSPTWTIAS